MQRLALPRSRAPTIVWGLDAAAALTVVFVLPLVSVYASRGVQTVIAAAALLALLAALAGGGLPAVGRRLARGFGERRLPPWTYLYTALMAWGALSALWAVDPAHSLDRALTIVIASTVATGLYLLLPRLDYPLQGLAGLLGVGGASLLLIIEFTGDGLLLEHLHDGDPHMLNRAMVTVSLLMWPVLALQKGPRRWLVRGGLIALVAIAALLSESETSVLALMVGLVVAGLAAWRPGLVLAGGIAASAVAFFGMPFIVRLLREWLPVEWLGSIAQRTSAEARLDIWDASAVATLHRPVFGWGLDASRFFGLTDLSAMAPGFTWTLPAMHHPHNAMLQAWLELGAVGSALLFGLTCGALLAARRLAPALAPWAFGCIAAILATLAVSHGLWQTWWLSLVILLPILFSLMNSK